MRDVFETSSNSLKQLGSENSTYMVAITLPLIHVLFKMLVSLIILIRLSEISTLSYIFHFVLPMKFGINYLMRVFQAKSWMKIGSLPFTNIRRYAYYYFT